MSPRETVRARVAEFLRALETEDLEERVAPVKCSKHPDHPECDTSEYAVVFYGVPEDDPGEGG